MAYPYADDRSTPAETSTLASTATFADAPLPKNPAFTFDSAEAVTPTDIEALNPSEAEFSSVETADSVEDEPLEVDTPTEKVNV